MITIALWMVIVFCVGLILGYAFQNFNVEWPLPVAVVLSLVAIILLLGHALWK